MFGARMQYVGGETTNNHLHVIMVELLAVLPEATAYVIYLGLNSVSFALKLYLLHAELP
jgi:hypothetical protein